MTDAMDYRPGAMGKLPAKTPCAECPLRRDSKRGALGGWTPEMYLRAMHGPADLACHMSKGFVEALKTGDRSAVTDPVYLREQRSCTGIAMYRANVGHIASGHAHEATKHTGFDYEQVFGSPKEFYDHHKTAKEGE